jgi:hypothetical protein
MSSWKWRRTPRSIFLRSEYLISLFLAASCIAALTSLRAIPWRKKNCSFISKNGCKSSHTRSPRDDIYSLSFFLSNDSLHYTCLKYHLK